jgi:predicted secreted protein
LEVDFPSDEYDIQGFSGSGDIRTANITLKQNATPGEHSIKVEANDGSFDSQSVGLSVLDKTPIKSIQASITENTLQIGTDGSATLTVKGYNGVDLDNLDVDFSTDQYEISPFVGSGDTYKATIKLASEASPGEHFITVKAEGVDNQEVSLSVLDKAPTNSIQASITTNTLKMGYEGGIAILTVKGYNNADLDQLDVTSEDQNQFQIQHLTTSDDISAWQIMLDSGATSGSHSITVKAKDITFDEQTVDVTVLAAEPTPSIRSIQASITENTLQIGEENSQATLAVKGYNGAILDQLEIAPLESGQFTFTDFGPVGDTYQTTIKLGSGATKGSHSITVKAKDSTFDEQTVDVTVLAVAPTKSIQASITTNDLQIDKGGQAILTVKGYNGADLSLLEATSTEANQFSIQGFTQVGDTYQAIIMLGDNPTEGSHSITVKASDASFGEQDVNVTVLAIAPTKSIQASITANTLQIGDNSSEATLTVKGYNGANLANNLKAQGDTEQFVIESFELIDDVYQATIKLGSIPTEGNHLISVASIDGTSFVGQDVGVSILARAPIPALSANIDNSLKISDSRTAMITVTSYNGANLPSTKPTQDSTIFDFTD